MSHECFCGCGREVPFGRKRMTNLMGARFRDDIALFDTALERSPDPDHDADLRRLVASGKPLRDKLRDLVHGTIDRRDYPKDASKRWLDEAGDHRKRLAYQAIDDGFVGWTGLKQAQLVASGESVAARIVDVRDTRVTVNERPRIEITMRAERPGREPLEFKRKVLLSRVRLPPQPGERVTVHYDPDDPSKFTFQAADLSDGDGDEPATPDRVEQIAKLAELRDSGALSDEEFTEAKQRLLADL